MNRTIMLLIPIVILVAMGLILLQQMWSGQNAQLQPESVAERGLPFANTTSPAAVSSPDLDEAIRREQMNRTQSSPALPVLDGMPATSTTPPAVTPPATATTPPAAQSNAAKTEGNGNTKSELGKLADASVAGQPGKDANSGAADELARQVASGSEPNGKGAAQTGAAKDAAAKDAAVKAPQQTKEVKENTKPQTAAQGTQTQASAQTAQAREVKATEEGAPAGKVAMTGISLKAEGSDMILTISGDKEFTYKSFTLTGPDRLVIDLAGDWSGVKYPNLPSNRLISEIRGGKFEKSHRIVMDLKAPLAGYEAKRVEDKTIRVRMY